MLEQNKPRPEDVERILGHKVDKQFMKTLEEIMDSWCVDISNKIKAVLEEEDGLKRLEDLQEVLFKI